MSRCPPSVRPAGPTPHPPTPLIREWVSERRWCRSAPPCRACHGSRRCTRTTAQVRSAGRSSGPAGSLRNASNPSCTSGCTPRCTAEAPVAVGVAPCPCSPAAPGQDNGPSRSLRSAVVTSPTQEDSSSRTRRRRAIRRERRRQPRWRASRAFSTCPPELLALTQPDRRVHHDRDERCRQGHRDHRLDALTHGHQYTPTSTTVATISARLAGPLTMPTSGPSRPDTA